MNANNFPGDNNFGEDNASLKEKYNSLKKKYISLLKDHRKVIKEYEKCNQELVEQSNDKKFLRNKIEEVLKSKGFTLQDIIKDDSRE